MQAPYSTTGSTGSPWAIVSAVLVGCGATAVAVVSQTGGWLVDQVLLVGGLDRLVPFWPLASLITALVIGTATLPLALLPRSRAVRTAGRAWLAGALTLGVLGMLRALPPVHHELYLGALAATAAVLAWLSARLSHRLAGVARSTDWATPEVAPPPPVREVPEVAPPPPVREVPEVAPPPAAGPSVVTLLAATAGLALLLPWVWLGALGGLLETVLAGLTAVAVGALAGALLDVRFWGTVAGGEPVRPARLVLLGGLVAGLVLLLVGAGVGQSGTQLPLLVALPPVGFALAALRVLSRRHPRTTGRTSTAWLVGLTVFGPLAFTDPEEISLLLIGSRDVPFWVAVAAGAGLVVALLLAIAYGLLLARPTARAPRRAVAAATTLVLLVTVGAVGVGAGQPGLHGERLFVVLRAQADLAGLPTGVGKAGRDDRAEEVYRRLVDTAERTQADLRRELRRLRLAHTPYYLVNGIEVDGGPVVRAWLSSRPEVARVLISQRLRPLPAPAEPSRGRSAAPVGPPWNITMIGADRVWSALRVTGAGVTVGSSDSGVDGRHPALAEGYRGGDDSWYDPWNGTRTPTDRSGHGTHTTGSAVGRGGIGVAPGADWVGCVNLDRNLGNPASYLDCLQFMLAPFPPGGDPFDDGRPGRAPEILTNSWGCPPIEGCDPRTLRSATDALEAAGILVVAAAGNTGPFCGSVQDPPARYPDVLTVGAVDRQRRVTDFSSRGPVPGGLVKPDLVAPGADVVSAMPGGGYAALDGTSMATPQVAGVVALMWSANPDLVGDLDQTRRLLRATTTAVPTGSGSGSGSGSGAQGGDCGDAGNVAGAGLVDAYAAVRAAQG
ncbi:S8 family serine peptidase [Micromonospora radicis]|uniref:Peptidase S8 n=1 Tax=Micromonospora radicis TaxID=1894971 RepID=A0A418MSZ3_9ACTN|nr:S8 family serine peptidase [Micromonospora radicis]RIV37244.1 peptidase S8 [Micromonospora radicis]